ncbi:hypothetical protein C8T65DRAFT_695615 [Cerioporus squamosus]|nr:hypothetical protein C8T65DRAFT_695615 [Cerioporus squamosus]
MAASPTPTSGFCPPRGPCQNPQCVADPGGPCAFFEVTDNNVSRDHALRPDEICAQCDHPWYQHRAQNFEQATQRGGCPLSSCGGFFALEPRDQWGRTTVCVCGLLLRAHSSAPSSGSGTPALSSAVPPQFTTTHPSLHGAPPSFHVPPVRPSSTATTLMPLPPPIAAYNGVRPVDAGSTNDRRNAAIVRHRTTTSSGSAPGPANAPRSRTMVTSTPPPGASVPAPTVLQLHPHHASAPAVAPSSLMPGDPAHAQLASATPVASSSSASPDPNYETFSVCFWPFAHPIFGRARSKFPRKNFSFTDWAFGKAVESLEHWGLLFTVTLAKSGSVYKSFGNQVVAQLAVNDITLPGYDTTRPWRSPLDLPFVLLSSSGRTTKVHAPFDGFNELTYTVANIHTAKLSLTVIKCPIGAEFMKHTFLRICPRYGDLQAPLANHPAYVLGAPGLADFTRIRAAKLPHPCFPFRALCEALEEVSPECRPECPPSSSPSSPQPAPVAGPSSRPAPRPRGCALPEAEAAPPALPAPIPVPPRRATVLEDYMRVDRPPTPPTPTSPASYLRAGCPPLDAVPSLSLLNTEVAMTQGSGHIAAGPTIDSVATGPVETEASVAMPRRSARMSTGGRAPAPRVCRTPESHASTPRSVSPGEDPSPVANTSSLDARAATDHSLHSHVPVHPPCRTEPLRELAKAQLMAWAERVVAAIPRGALSSAGLRPKIRGRDPKEAASMLIFLIQWLFTHSPTGPITQQKREAFQEAFSREFSQDGAYCELVPLSEIIRHTRHLDIQIDAAIGDSPIRAVLRNVVYLVVGRSYACRVDEPFMAAVDAGLLESVQPWRTWDITQPLPQEPGHPLICRLAAADIDPEHYGTDTLSPQDVDSIEQDLVSYLVFGARQVADDPDMHAFTDGIFAAHPDRPTLIGTFNGLARDYIAAMCNKRLDNVQVLLDHIDFASGVDHSQVDLTGEEVGGTDSIPAQGAEGSGMSIAEWDQTFENEFQVAFVYYMKQAGHPDNDGIRKLVGETFDSDAGDPLLRARMFLTIMSGSDLVPVEKEWTVKGDRCPKTAEAPGNVGPIPAATQANTHGGAQWTDYTTAVVGGIIIPTFSATLFPVALHLVMEPSSAEAECALTAIQDEVSSSNVTISDIEDPWTMVACAQLADRLFEASREIEFALDYLRQGLHRWPTPSEDPFTDQDPSAERIPSQYEGSSDGEMEDYPDAVEMTPPPPWEAWFWGESSGDDWFTWRPLGLIDGEDEPEWPSQVLLQLEEAMDPVIALHGGESWRSCIMRSLLTAGHKQDSIPGDGLAQRQTCRTPVVRCRSMHLPPYFFPTILFVRNLERESPSVTPMPSVTLPAPYVPRGGWGEPSPPEPWDLPVLIARGDGVVCLVVDPDSDESANTLDGLSLAIHVPLAASMQDGSGPQILVPFPATRQAARAWKHGLPFQIDLFQLRLEHEESLIALHSIFAYFGARHCPSDEVCLDLQWHGFVRAVLRVVGDQGETDVTRMAAIAAWGREHLPCDFGLLTTALRTRSSSDPGGKADGTGILLPHPAFPNWTKMISPSLSLEKAWMGCRYKREHLCLVLAQGPLGLLTPRNCLPDTAQEM